MTVRYYPVRLSDQIYRETIAHVAYRSVRMHGLNVAWKMMKIVRLNSKTYVYTFVYTRLGRRLP
jgi:hypothetical protein